MAFLIVRSASAQEQAHILKQQEEVQGSGQGPGQAQPVPSREEFVNAIFHTVVDSAFSSYYLLDKADTCLFVKFDIDEWTKYGLFEPVPITVLNELARKVYFSERPYRWQRDRLSHAFCITNIKADSVVLDANHETSIPHHLSMSKREFRRALRKRKEELAHLQPWQKIFFSFSQPQFTDDGQYAVIDLNFICGMVCGTGFTCLFRHTSSGWKLIARHPNWTS